MLAVLRGATAASWFGAGEAGQAPSLHNAREASISVKTRLDKLLVDRGLTPSRERAQALILAGKVLVNEQKIEKAGASIDPGSSLRLLREDLRYVSRGGLKLEKAIEHWRIDLLSGQSMSRHRRFHRRIQRLHAAARRRQGDCR